MKKTFILEEYLKTNKLTGTKAPGDLYAEISDVAVEDWKNQKSPAGEPLTHPMTINQVKAAYGGSSTITIFHPISNQRYTVDLSPWDTIDGDRYLRIDLGWTRKRQS